MREQGDEGEATSMTMIGVLQKEEEEGDIVNDERARESDLMKEEERMRETMKREKTSGTSRRSQKGQNTGLESPMNELQPGINLSN